MNVLKNLIKQMADAIVLQKEFLRCRELHLYKAHDLAQKKIKVTE